MPCLIANRDSSYREQGPVPRAHGDQQRRWSVSVVRGYALASEVHRRLDTARAHPLERASHRAVYGLPVPNAQAVPCRPDRTPARLQHEPCIWIGLPRQRVSQSPTEPSTNRIGDKSDFCPFFTFCCARGDTQRLDYCCGAGWGTADNSALVYACCGSLMISSRLPCSTICPLNITAMRSQT